MHSAMVYSMRLAGDRVPHKGLRRDTDRPHMTRPNRQSLWSVIQA